MLFLFNFRNYSPNVGNIQRCEVEFNITLPRGRIFVLLYTPSTKQKVGECQQGTEYSSDNRITFSLKKNQLVQLFGII